MAFIAWPALDDAYTAAIREGPGPAFDRYLDLGPTVVDHVRAIRADDHHVQPPSGFPRTFVEHASFLLADVAARYPQEFLAAFVDERWDDDSDVVTALAYTDDPTVPPRLARVLRTGSRFARVSSAVGLGRFDDPEAVAALLGALDDPEYLVIFHAIASLGDVGGPAAIPVLMEVLDLGRASLSTQAQGAIRAIESRSQSRPS